MKLAIVKLSALGDIVHAMVALQFIKQQLPNSEIDWLVEAHFADLLAHNPDINRVLPIHLKALKKKPTQFVKQFTTLKRYQQHNYDLVIDAQGLLKSAITARLLSSQLTGFNAQSIREKAASWFYKTTVDAAYDANTIDRNAKVLAEPLGFTITQHDIITKQAFLFFAPPAVDFSLYLHPKKKNIIFVIGSTWPSRNYPAAKFVTVAEDLQQHCLVIWGNKWEFDTATWMATQSKFIHVMPKLTLNDLKALIAHADLLIGNDTGPTHIAWGLNKPSITLFGPTPISRVYQTNINKVLKSSSIVNPYRLNKDDFSIADISEKNIIDMAIQLLAAKEPTVGALPPA